MNRWMLSLLFAGLFVAEADPAPPLGDRVPNKLGAIPSLKPIKQPRVVWKFISPSKKKGLSDVASANGMVFVGDDSGFVFGLTAKHGKQVWKFNSLRRVFHQPMSDGYQVYFTNEAGLFAVEFGTGLQQWQHPLRRAARTLVFDGTVFVADGDGVMHAYDVEGGKEKWSRSFADDIPEDPVGFDRARGGYADSVARPVGISSDGETVYQSVFDHCRVVSFDCQSGKCGPNFQTAGWIWSDAAVDDRCLFVGSQDDFIHCFDKKTGKPLWKTKTGGRIESCPAVSDEHVIIPSCDGNVYCLSKQTGEELWRFSIEQGGTRAIYSAPILSNGIIYFAAGQGVVYAVAAKTGLLEWKLRPSPGSETFSCLATDGTRLFVQCRKGKTGEDAIYAIGPSQL